MALNPKDEEDPAVNVFDLWEGADFGLEIKNVAGYRNYDDSKFKSPTPLFKGDEDEMKKVYDQLYKLQPFIDEKKFKSFEELEKKFQEVTSGVNAKIQKKADELFPEAKETLPEIPPAFEKKVKKPKEEKEVIPEVPFEEKKPTKKTKKEAKKEPSVDPEISENALDYYEKMALED
jgi:hypothetical protein